MHNRFRFIDISKTVEGRGRVGVKRFSESSPPARKFPSELQLQICYSMDRFMQVSVDAIVMDYVNQKSEVCDKFTSALHFS